GPSHYAFADATIAWNASSPTPERVSNGSSCPLSSKDFARSIVLRESMRQVWDSDLQSSVKSPSSTAVRLKRGAKDPTGARLSSSDCPCAEGAHGVKFICRK